MANRGYSGYYKESYLRSSYEYVFARILDFDKTDWTYEEKIYSLNDRNYKPDFFLYKNKKLEKVVEVKSEIKRENEKARANLSDLEKLHGIKGELVNYKELATMCKERGLKITCLMSEWIKSGKTTINKSLSGPLNGHFGMKHSVQSKKLIGEKTKERFAKNPEPYLEGLRKGTERVKVLYTGIEKTPRELRKCPYCTKTFRVIVTSPQKYCSTDCLIANNYQKGRDTTVHKAKLVRDQIKNFMENWCLEHKELVLSTPYNKITTNLRPMFDEIEATYHIKDMRILSKSVFGKDKGRKELLKYLKNFVSDQNMYADPDQK